MGLDPKSLPDALLRKIPKADRVAMGKAGRTFEEALASQLVKSEKELQLRCVQLCDQRNLFYIRARMDKKTTTRKGLFDMTVFLPSGKYLAVEFKIADGELREEQKECITEFWNKTGKVVHIIMSVAQFRELLDLHHP